MVLKTVGTKIKSLVGEDRGVSPVIGVILMVAITVILAAVIGAFVLGLGDEIGTEANAGVNISQDSSTVTASWTSAGNADEIRFAGDYSGTAKLENVGETASFAVGTDISSGDTLTVIAVINPGGDETTTVIQTYEVK